jgi:hypothetical protein
MDTERERSHKGGRVGSGSYELVGRTAASDVETWDDDRPWDPSDQEPAPPSITREVPEADAFDQSRPALLDDRDRG